MNFIIGTNVFHSDNVIRNKIRIHGEERVISGNELSIILKGGEKPYGISCTLVIKVNTVNKKVNLG